MKLRNRLAPPEQKPGLTIDQQLSVFLERWIATRVGQVEKYRLQAERYRGDSFLYPSMKRHQRHYQHEVDMLRELKARSL